MNVKYSEITQGSNYEGLEDYLADKGDNDLESYINQYIVSGYFEYNATAEQKIVAKGFFNNEALHSPALALTTVSNTILR